VRVPDQDAARTIRDERREYARRESAVNSRYESFTVRVWVRGGGVVRGEVVEVHSGESQRFTDLQDIARFIDRQIAAGGHLRGDRG
jgi:hypothetical protein